VELYLPSHNMPFWHVQGEFYICGVLQITQPTACKENPNFKKNIPILCLALCQEPFLWKALLHLSVSSTHIVMYQHAHRNSDN